MPGRALLAHSFSASELTLQHCGVPDVSLTVVCLVMLVITLQSALYSLISL